MTRETILIKIIKKLFQNAGFVITEDIAVYKKWSVPLTPGYGRDARTTKSRALMRQRERDYEAGAFSRFAVEADVAVVSADDPAGGR